jgi:O-antigen/teichoic acid export membrane protein/O-antigen ligase
VIIAPVQPSAPRVAARPVALVMGSCVLFMGRSWEYLPTALRREPLIPLFVGIAMASFLWSVAPSVSLRTSLAFGLTTFFAYYLAIRHDLRDIVRYASWAMLAGAFVNYVFIAALPRYSKVQDPLIPGSFEVTGVLTQKNSLGAISALAAIIMFMHARNLHRNRLFWYGAAMLNIGLLLISRSKTALVVFLFLAMMSLGSKVLRAKKQAFGAVIVATVGSLALSTYILTTNLGNFAALLGKDATLTGRTPLWRAVIVEIEKRPFLGAGWQGFWRGYFSPAHEVWLKNTWLPPSAHNGVLAIMCDLGLLGTIPVLWLLARSIPRGIRFARWRLDSVGILPLALTMFILLQGVSEDGEVGRTATWVLFVAGAVAAGNRLRPTGTTSLLASGDQIATRSMLASVGSPLLGEPAAEVPEPLAVRDITAPLPATVARRVGREQPTPIRRPIPMRVASQWDEDDKATSDLDVAAGAAVLGADDAGTRSLAKNASWGLIGEFVTLGVQTLTFLILARQFGPSVYGLYGATLGVALIASAVSTVGAPFVLMRTVSTGRDELGPACGRAYVTSAGGGLVAVVLLTLLSRLILPSVSTEVFFLLLLTELVFTQPANMTRFAAQAAERLDLVPRLVGITYGIRLVAVLAYFGLASSPSLTAWARTYAVVGVVSCVATIYGAHRMLRVPPELELPTRANLKQGIVFSLSLSASLVKNDADKPLLARLGDANAAGLYTSAYRFIGMLTLPGKSIADASFARFFRAGERGPREVTAFARKLALTTTAITGTAAVVAFALAPLVGTLLGPKYAEAVTIIRWLVIVPVFLAWQQYAFYGLVSLGQERKCVYATLVGSVINLTLNVLLIPHHSWRGSAIATLVAESTLTVLLWAMLGRAVRVADQTRDALEAAVPSP